MAESIEFFVVSPAGTRVQVKATLDELDSVKVRNLNMITSQILKLLSEIEPPASSSGITLAVTPASSPDTQETSYGYWSAELVDHDWNCDSTASAETNPD